MGEALMNLSLTSELEKFIAEKVRGGLYRSASEVVREGLRLLVQQDRIQQETLKSLHLCHHHLLLRLFCLFHRHL